MRIMRLLGGLLGVLWMLVGVSLFFQEEQGFWRKVIVPIGFVGAGWYFLGYAFTGTRTFFWFGRKSRSKDNS